MCACVCRAYVASFSTVVAIESERLLLLPPCKQSTSITKHHECNATFTFTLCVFVYILLCADMLRKKKIRETIPKKKKKKKSPTTDIAVTNVISNVEAKFKYHFNLQRLQCIWKPFLGLMSHHLEGTYAIANKVNG